MTTANTLRDAFLEDHRKLTRGLRRLLDALETDALGAARAAADQLDQDAGPHMEFEEHVFYPTLARILGSDTIDELYEEHAQGQEAVRTLLNRPGGRPLTPTERQRLIGQAKTTLEHAIGCGTLLSYVDRFDPAVRREMLVRLHELRRKGRRWTALVSQHHQNA